MVAVTRAVRPRRSSAGLFLVAVIAVALAVVATRVGDVLPSLSNPFASDTVDRTGPTMLEALEDVSRYEAATGNFEVMVDVEDDTRFVPSFISGERTLFLGRGTVDASVDFSDIADGAVVRGKDGAVTVTLPAARLSEARIDPDQSGVVDRDRGALDRVAGALGESPSDDRQLYRLAETRLERAAAESDLLTRAEANTTEMVEGMLGSLGHDDVTVVFEEPPAP